MPFQKIFLYHNFAKASPLEVIYEDMMEDIDAMDYEDSVDFSNLMPNGMSCVRVLPQQDQHQRITTRLMNTLHNRTVNNMICIPPPPPPIPQPDFLPHYDSQVPFLISSRLKPTTRAILNIPMPSKGSIHTSNSLNSNGINNNSSSGYALHASPSSYNFKFSNGQQNDNNNTYQNTNNINYSNNYIIHSSQLPKNGGSYNKNNHYHSSCTSECKSENDNENDSRLTGGNDSKYYSKLNTRGRPTIYKRYFQKRRSNDIIVMEDVVAEAEAELEYEQEAIGQRRILAQLINIDNDNKDLKADYFYYDNSYIEVDDNDVEMIDLSTIS